MKTNGLVTFDQLKEEYMVIVDEGCKTLYELFEMFYGKQVEIEIHNSSEESVIK